MTVYTQSAPFEFEGVKVWRTFPMGDVAYEAPQTWFDLRLQERIAKAMHAFIEAERDTWAWTKDDRTEARRGRWYVQRATLGWRVFHDDFTINDGPGFPWAMHCDGAEANGLLKFHVDHPASKNALASFLAFRATQTPPPPAQVDEPQELGAKVCVGSKTHVRVPVYQPGDKPWVLPGQGIRSSWAELCALGRVLPIMPSPGESTTPPAPEEPSGFGYVGYVDNGDGELYDVYRTDDRNDPFTWTSRKDGCTGISTWKNIPYLETFTAVTP